MVLTLLVPDITGLDPPRGVKFPNIPPPKSGLVSIPGPPVPINALLPRFCSMKAFSAALSPSLGKPPRLPRINGLLAGLNPVPRAPDTASLLSPP
jgi:hypothetical protein